MNNTSEIRQDARAVEKAKFRMGLWLMLLYLICLAFAYFTFPFVGHTTSAQNLMFGVVVAMPFWICVLLYMVRTYGAISPD